VQYKRQLRDAVSWLLLPIRKPTLTALDIDQPRPGRSVPQRVQNSPLMACHPNRTSAHGKGFGREIPLLNIERLRPKIGPESGFDPMLISAYPIK
jgi:hypothetical protein